MRAQICRQGAAPDVGSAAGDPDRHRQQPGGAGLRLAAGYGCGGAGAVAAARDRGGAPFALVSVGAGAAVGPALVRQRVSSRSRPALAPPALLEALLALEARSGAAAARRTRPARSTSTCSTTTGRNASRRGSCCRTRGCTSGVSCWRRWPRSRRNGAIRCSASTAAALLAALPPGAAGSGVDPGRMASR